MKLENNFRKALALEKQKMNEEMELQVTCSKFHIHKMFLIVIE